MVVNERYCTMRQASARGEGGMYGGLSGDALVAAALKGGYAPPPPPRMLVPCIETLSMLCPPARFQRGAVVEVQPPPSETGDTSFMHAHPRSLNLSPHPSGFRKASSLGW